MLLPQIGARKRRSKVARMFFSLIYFFAPFSIFYIPHNYVILQIMATMSCNIIIITSLKIFPTKKLKSKC